jgi:hypothetical protein
MTKERNIARDGFSRGSELHIRRLRSSPASGLARMRTSFREARSGGMAVP